MKPRRGKVQSRKRRPSDGQDNKRYMTHVIECFYDDDWQYVGPAGANTKCTEASVAAIQKCVDGVLGDSIDAIIAEATT